MLLVLLIMLILTMPVQVNVTPVDLSAKSVTPTLPVLEQNTIDTADRLSWNGTPLSVAALRAQVAAASALDQHPLLRFESDALAS